MTLKRLTIRYDDVTLFDGEVAEFQWAESGSSITVKGSAKRAPQGGGSSQLLDLLAGAAAKRKPVPREAVVEPAPAEVEPAAKDDG